MSVTADVTFASSTGRPMRAALALPGRTERRPGVIVIHEIFGLNDDIRRIAGRFADLEAARTWLATRREVDPQRTGVVGFCLGGGFALLYAVRAPLGVSAVFYGDVPKTAAALRGTCPILAGYGGRDRIFAPQGRRLEALLTELDVPHDVRIYPDAGHSYMSEHSGVLATIGYWGPMAARYDPAAAADSWTRIESFFRQHLG